MTSIVALRAPVALRAAAATRKQRAPLAAKITAAAKPTVKAPMVVKSVATKSSVARLASAATFLGSAQAAFASEVAQLAEGDDQLGEGLREVLELLAREPASVEALGEVLGHDRKRVRFDLLSGEGLRVRLRGRLLGPAEQRGAHCSRLLDQVG